MTTSFESEPGTQDLPQIPPVDEMKTWDEEKVLRWIQQKDRNILKGDSLDNFNKAEITGRALLASSFEFFKDCGLSRGASLALKNLVDEFKAASKFIPWT